MGFSKNQEPLFGSPFSKDHNILGSILGALVYGSPHMARGRYSLVLVASSGNGFLCQLQKASMSRLGSSGRYSQFLRALPRQM